MARNAASRKELSAAGLLGIARRCFEAVADPVARRGGASLAVYGLKYASLLKFDEAARGDDAGRSNLRRLYGVSRVPSDTRMREASACRSAGTGWTRGRCGPATGGCSRRCSAARAWRGSRAWTAAGDDGVRHRFRWLNGVPLNDANFDLEVNFWSTGRPPPAARPGTSRG